VFDVGGTIFLKERLFVHGPNVTIDGFTAPSPGITLRGLDPANTPAMLIVEGDYTPGNVVIRGIRHRASSDDGIRILGRELRTDTAHPLVSNVVIDHVSVTGQGDGAIDVTEGASNVTIQWSILGTGATDQELNLIQFGAHAVSLHHNLYVDAKARMPGCYDSEVPAPGLVCDVRNNLIWNTSQAGTEVRFNATANVINNYYKPGSTAILDQMIWLIDDTGAQTSSAYTSGNVSTDPRFGVSNGDRSTPFPVDPAFVPNTTDATTAARAVRDQAGARCSTFGLDATDQGFINEITIP
jgi:pectate lyase